MIGEYDSGFKRFLLLNEISQQTDTVVEKVNAYILEKDHLYLEEYLGEKEKLLANKERLQGKIGNHDNFLALLNYENMLDSFMEECDLAISAFKAADIHLYSQHFNEASAISSFIHETTLTLIDKELSSYQPYFGQMTERAHYLKMTAIFLFSGTLIFSALFAVKISGGITRPLGALSAAAQRISSGVFSGRDVEVTSKDELKLLSETFNHMRRSIFELVNEMKDQSELDKLLKELELKSLQNQINPHFLFNTLNNVSRMAYLEDAHETVKLVEAISALLRYNLANIDKPSTMREETDVVMDYFFIQQTRFGERIRFIADIDESCLDVPVPRMTLQPIVENAFIHGVESIEGESVIKLSIYRNAGGIVAEVMDDGKGMASQTIEKIMKAPDDSQRRGYPIKKTSGHSTGIGIRNVIKRLQIFYQIQNVAEIDSEPGKGTTFRILIPHYLGAEGRRSV